MPRNKYPERTRARLLEAATRLFLERGYRSTSIQDIVDACGDMTRGAFYHHFASKQDIFDQVTERLMLETEHSIEQSIGLSNGTGLEKLRELMLMSLRSPVQIRFVHNSPDFYRSEKYVATHLRDSVDHIAPRLVPIIEEGMRDGSIAAQDAECAAQALLLLANIWLSPVILDADEALYLRKVGQLAHMLAGSGMDLVNGELRSALQDYYRAVHAQNPEG